MCLVLFNFVKCSSTIPICAVLEINRCSKPKNFSKVRSTASTINVFEVPPPAGVAPELPTPKAGI
ncbi:hypothetical protein APD39_04000 [Acinetobacter pittii]|uniref:hypothetical protein n=1 Tax=Acinetobacter pittii TaxID=48296 RepID=UPI0007085219|nr:hypothetical protein [Acinetobacter pittii]KQE19548.1 hypothetical protein APD38_05570 [Acinetobacter pittii]KQE22752.1 hypothetical protein APD39_04000 [Acinetobacter pittii]